MQPDARRVARNRFGMWASALLLGLALIGFVAAVNVLAPNLPASLAGAGLVLTGLALSLVPAILWLTLFYLQDRLEPEPKHYVVGIFILAGLLATAIGQPAIRSLFAVQDWMYESWWVQLLASVLVIGFIQEFLKYAAVRYAIYSTSEFDQRVDGVIYGTAAGLGYATVLNFGYVLDHQGVDLGIGAMVATITAMAHASFGGLVGYFLGQAKFETTPRWWLPLGLALAALLNGVFFFLEDQVTLQGLHFTPLNGVILAAVFAGTIFFIVFFLIRRANAETLAIAALQTQAPAEASG